MGEDLEGWPLASQDPTKHVKKRVYTAKGVGN